MPGQPRLRYGHESPIAMADISTDHLAHREALGKAYTIWMRRNGFSQQTSHDWASATGSNGPHNSQTSLFQRGRLDPKPLFFVAMGRWNKAIADQDFAGITKRSLLDRLKGSVPFMTHDDRVATALDFFALFIGEQPIAEQYAAPAEPAYTEADAKGISDMCREGFRRIATDQMLSPKEAWESLKSHCSGMSAAEVTRFREILAGWEDWSADEVNALSIPGEMGKPAQALERWGDTKLNNHVIPA